LVDFEQKSEYLDFVNEMLDTDFTTRHARSIASVIGDRILGVVVFSRFSAFNCEWTAASTSPLFLRPPFIQACFRYAFIQCALKRVSAIVDERNTRSQRLLKKLGFTKEAELESMFGDSNGILFKMLKPQCRWIDG
jgi:hypothetical protein